MISNLLYDRQPEEAMPRKQQYSSPHWWFFGNGKFERMDQVNRNLPYEH